jgi:hypothetical protein
LLALDQFLELRKLIPHGEIAGELRAIARDDERACRDECRLRNRLRSDLMACFPAMLMIAGDDLGAVVVLKLLARWPSHQLLAAADPAEIEAFVRAARHGWPDRFATRIADALAAVCNPGPHPDRRVASTRSGRSGSVADGSGIDRGPGSHRPENQGCRQRIATARHRPRFHNHGTARQRPLFCGKAFGRHR